MAISSFIVTIVRSRLRVSLRGLWFALLWLSYLALFPQLLDEGGKLLGEQFVERYCVLGLQTAPDLGGKLSIRERPIKWAVRV